MRSWPKRQRRRNRPRRRRQKRRLRRQNLPLPAELRVSRARPITRRASSRTAQTARDLAKGGRSHNLSGIPSSAFVRSFAYAQDDKASGFKIESSIPRRTEQPHLVSESMQHGGIHLPPVALYNVTIGDGCGAF